MSQYNATGQFYVQNGTIVDPNGNSYAARGVAVTTIAQPSADTLKSDFPGINFVRLPVWNYTDPSALANYVNSLTQAGIVVEIENHDNGTDGKGGASGQIFTGNQLAKESNWYSSLGSAFKNNPMVWFGTANEPSETDSNGNADAPALSQWQKATYNAIRNTGNTNMIMLEANAGTDNNGNPVVSQGYDASQYAGMTNVAWDVHFYGWQTNYSQDQNANNNFVSAMAHDAQQITSANGTVPVIVGEFGNSTSGFGLDPNGYQAVQAVLNSGYGFAAWMDADGGPGDGLTVNNGTGLSAYGQQVAQAIANGANGNTQLTNLPAMVSASSAMSNSDGGSYNISNNVQNVVLGDSPANLTFTDGTPLNVTGGSATSYITATSGNNTFTEGSGDMYVRGGSGADSYVFPNTTSQLSVLDFNPGKGDTLTISSSLQNGMQAGSDGANGILISFAGSKGLIDLENTATLPPIKWS